jgi:hypothetical protein
MLTVSVTLCTAVGPTECIGVAEVLALYCLLVLEISGHLVPLFVAQAGLRRALRSRGFNRCLYGYVSLFSSLVLIFLLCVSRDDLAFYLLAQIAAWMTLPFWLAVTDAARATRNRLCRLAAAAEPGGAVAA